MEPLFSALDPPSPCQYLPRETWQLRHELFPNLDAVTYAERLRTGWRRFGPVVFRPECPTCRQCLSLRVPAATFRPNQSQRRAWKRNAAEVRVSIGAPASSPEKLDLFHRYHRWKHQQQGWPDAAAQDLAAFVDNPFPTEEWTYELGGRLIGVGYVDALAGGLSAIYFFHEPDQRHRSLGTFNVLSLLQRARAHRLPHVYLGYYVAGCRSLEYKARFRPHEIYTPDGRWASPTEGRMRVVQ
jgi:arginine-tRNA-protein transferase